MQTRAKWYSSPEITPIFLRELTAAARANPFTTSSSRGFILDNVRSGAATGRFIERIDGKRSFKDPLGNHIELPFVTFESVTFRISSTFPELQLVEPPRSLRRFSMFLAELISLPFSIRPISVDPVEWAEALAATWGKVTVNELKCENLIISSSMSADIVLAGSGDILASAKEYLGKKLGRASFIRASFNMGNRVVSAYLFDNGSVKFCQPEDVGLVVDAREKLAKLISPSIT